MARLSGCHDRPICLRESHDFSLGNGFAYFTKLDIGVPVSLFMPYTQQDQIFVYSGLAGFIISALVIALLLLTYDPVIEPISSGNLPLIIVVLVGIAIGIIVYQRRKQHMKKPSRPRIQAP